VPGPQLGGPGGSGPQKATNLNSSRSNIYRKGKDAGAAPGGSGPQKATNLNSSRSNIYRKADPKKGSGAAARATTVKSSKSNTSD
jgi:hypothetical protein